jgi:hypothetical protein
MSSFLASGFSTSQATTPPNPCPPLTQTVGRLRREQKKAEYMNANSEYIKSIKSLVSISKPILLISSIALGIILAVLSYYKLFAFNSVAVISAIISLVALVLSITFLVFQKRASIYSTLGLIISILFICASLMLGYGNTLSFPENLYTGQISSGVGGMGFGLALMTLSIISFDLNKSGLTSNLKYSKALMVWVFICGIFIFAFGIYMFVLGCQYLLNG